MWQVIEIFYPHFLLCLSYRSHFQVPSCYYLSVNSNHKFILPISFSFMSTQTTRVFKFLSKLTHIIQYNFTKFYDELDWIRSIFFKNGTIGLVSIGGWLKIVPNWTIFFICLAKHHMSNYIQNLSPTNLSS